MKSRLIALAACCAFTTSAFALHNAKAVEPFRVLLADNDGVHPPQFVRTDNDGVHPPQLFRNDNDGVHPPQLVLRFR